LKMATLYAIFPLALSSLFYAVRASKKTVLPRILKKQLKLFLQYVFIPYWLLDVLQVVMPFVFSSTWGIESYTFFSISTILLTVAIYLCARKIIGLRFLNLHNDVQSPARVIFMHDFKHILEQLSYVTNAHELRHITQGFFKELFNIPLGKTILHVRKLQTHGNLCFNEHDNLDSSLIESFIGAQDEPVSHFIKQSKLLIYDEIAFSNFYEETPERNAVLSFLEEINADIFLPIYEKNNLIAYIIIDRHARFNNFYSHIEQDEMLIFGRYLGNIINLLQNKSLSSLAQQTKDLQEELYRKHQEINQYKESIRSFLRTNKQEHIGIIFYKNRKFIFGNQAAKELVTINVNAQSGHPFTKKIKNLAQLVETYKAPQTVFANDSQGNQLILSGVQHLDSNHVIILIYYPEVSDVLKKQVSLLQDPSEWDYLLYLETTQSGKLINQLIPGSGHVLLKFKIELLKLALSKKAILLDLPDEDLTSAAEILHHISLREKIHVLALNGPVKGFDIAIKLFGMNPIFGLNKNNEKPLLSTLDGVGTLFIKNIHLLDLESQEYLADFIHHGLYRIFKSDQKVSSNVRIICSSNQNLHNLVQEGKFSKSLFAELKHTTVVMPCLLTLPDEELLDLAQGFSEQAIKTQTFEHLLALSEQDKNKLTSNRPSSLNELKNKVQQILIKKSKQNDVYQETTFNPAYQVTDPELAGAARLGKQALKDEKIMIMLWNKFKSQNKIATFLGVNRSSINRRCKKYSLE
ncbi:MAG TPA: sigma 54-interacting transcriptional regulator, partial [Candidatus Babeliales bacterium]|nr:sigma 54-interacting transcriptional regulator [Candidatus Babeliales bacterium]